MKKVTIYTTDTCAPCAQLKKYLTSKGVSYTLLNADEPEHYEELVRNTGVRIVPTTVINGVFVQGLQYAKISKLLENL